MLEQPAGQDLFLDFRGIKIAKYIVNGVEALAEDQSLFSGHRVKMPTGLLKVGDMNHVQMVFLNKYRKDSEGLHSFIDTEDSQ